MILGVSVNTSNGPDFEIEDDAVNSAAFFEQLEIGDFVEAKDDTGSATLRDLATEVEIEEEHDDDD